MIPLGDEGEGRGCRFVAVLVSVFLHAGVIGALVAAPDKLQQSLLSAMDFTVEKKAPPPALPPPPEETKEEKRPDPVRVAVKKPAPAAPESAPPPPPPKAEVSGESLSGEGTWGLGVSIGDNRIGSFTGEGAKQEKPAQDPGQGGAQEEKPKPPPKPVVATKPAVVYEETIPYPEEARQLEVEGDVVMEVAIDSAGAVVSVKVLKDPGAGLGKAAAKALRKFRFSPALDTAGTPVPYTIKYVYSFVLDE